MFQRASVVALLLLLIPVSAFAGGAPVAIRVPAKRICVGEPIRIGVRYTGVVYDRLPYDDNPRWFRARIFDPEGRQVLRRQGLAPRAWRFWTYEPSRAGAYRTRYGTAALAARFTTRVGSC